MADREYISRAAQAITRRSLMGALAAMAIPRPAQSTGGDNSCDPTRCSMRFACSLKLMGDVNLNDARAAIKGWALEIAKSARLEVPEDGKTLFSSEQLLEAVRRGTVDGFAATTPEYLKVASFADPHWLLIADFYANSGEEYVILTHQDSLLHSVADLKGRELLLFNNPSACMALNWLETLLDNAGFCSPERFFKQITPLAKLSRVVLPIYFRQTDACLTTRRGFTTMIEMNPDLGRKMRTVATAPRVVPICMAFHRNCPAEIRTRFYAALAGLTKTAAGRQLLTLFQTHGMVVSDQSAIRSAEEMVNASERARARAARRTC